MNRRRFLSNATAIAALSGLAFGQGQPPPAVRIVYNAILANLA